MAKRRRVAARKSLPASLRDVAQQYATDHEADDLDLAGSLLLAFGDLRHDREAHRRAVWLCVLATRRVLFGWSELECEGNAPERAVSAAAKWVQTGRNPRGWGRLFAPAPAIREGEVIGDHDACRAEPIASAAARTAIFVHTGDAIDGALVLREARGAAEEGVYWPDSMPFEDWTATVAVPAAYELRELTEEELRL
jgi:hypothetical protein